VHRWLEANGQPIRDEGRQRGAVVVIRDITERSLHRLQNEFMALASHELRTPLTPLHTSLQMLLKQLEKQPTDAPARHHAEISIAQVQRLARLVDDLLDASRLQSGKLILDLKPVHLNELLAQTVELAQAMTKGQAIVLAGGETPVVVQGDVDRLQQVV